MKLSDWVRVNGVTPVYARRLFNEGKIPGARQISERTIVFEDMTEILTSFCARFYGRRGSEAKAKRVIEAIHA